MKKYLIIGAAALFVWSMGCGRPAKVNEQEKNEDVEQKTEEQKTMEQKTEEQGETSLLVFRNPETVNEESIRQCEEYAALVESYMESSSFESAVIARVEELTELLSHHYEVAGRSDGDGREYYLAVRKRSAPEYEDFQSLSAGYVDGPDFAVPVCQIGYYDKDICETVLYQVPEYKIKLFGDPETPESLDMFCFVPLDASEDRYFSDAFEESGRLELDFMKGHPGLSFYDDAVPSVTFYYQDEDTIKFWSEPYECSITLDAGACEKIKQLLENGEEKRKFGSEEEAFTWVRSQEPSVRTTGISLNLEGNKYRFLGSRECRGYVMTRESENVCLEYNEAVSMYVTDRIKEVVGRDYGSFTDTWFDVPLISASLEFPRHEKDEDGRLRFCTAHQTVTEPEKLEKLGYILGNAVQGHEVLSGCPYTGVLNLKREDGETLQMFVASDSCDSITYEGRIGFEYGRQEDLAEIFDDAMR